VEQVPQLPPQPSSPHPLPAQLGVHATHWPFALQEDPCAQAPQLLPQPSSPQLLPVHASVQATHWPLALHADPAPQAPQRPPQPSLPQLLPAQAGVHVGATHCPLSLQLLPVLQSPQLPPQPSSPQTLPLQDGVQLCAGGGIGLHPSDASAISATVEPRATRIIEGLITYPGGLVSPGSESRSHPEGCSGGLQGVQ